MRPSFHPRLVNPPRGDPGVFVECLFEHRAMLFDVGEIQPLSPRQVLSLSDIFVSHAHMDHFIGFDRVLRICLGRDKLLRLFGPAGFIEQVGHRLAGYSWNLVHRYVDELAIRVTEIRSEASAYTATFRSREAFGQGETLTLPIDGGVILEEPALRVRAAVLDHKIPCLAYALEEKSHINIWKNALDELGLPVGPWLRELKAAVRREEPDDFAVRAWWRAADTMHERYMPLGLLREKAVRIVPGQKISYVADAVYHDENARRIVALAAGSDQLFVEAAFLQEDALHAAAKYHLTARQAGLLARRAGVKRLIPFHFSPKYCGQEDRLEAEAQAAFGHGELPGC